MATHLYAIGQSVLLGVAAGQSSKAGAFKVETRMPPLGSSLQYRIKSDTETFSRVVEEHQLSPFGLVAKSTIIVRPRTLPGEAD